MKKLLLCLSLFILMSSVCLAQKPQALEPTINECTSSFLKITFKDRLGTEVVPDSVKWWVDDYATGTNVFPEKNCPTNCSDWPAATIVLNMDASANRIVNPINKQETHLISINYVYQTTLFGTQDYVYTVRNLLGINCNTGPTPLSTLTPTLTFTPTLTYTPSKTPTQTKTPTP